jgi:hypothetical protein
VQQLHLVGFTTESDHLILSAKKGAKSGSFVVPLDERLLEVIADAVRRRNAESGDEALTTPPELQPPRESPKRTSLLSPREIQARLRAGRTLGQVAREAVTDEDWVAKFAPPVLAERERIISRARELVFTKPRRGESAEPLGLSVRWNLADRGVRLIDDEFDAGWSAFHIGDTLWGITFEFVSRARKQRAEWEVDLADDVLVARNRVASDLAYVEPGRRRRLILTPDPPEESKARRSGGGLAAGEPEPAVAARSNARSTSRTGASKASRSRTKKAARPAKRAKPTAPSARARKTTKAAKPAATSAKRAAKSAKGARPAKATRTTKASRSAKSTKSTKSAKTAKTARARKTTRASGSSKRAARPRAEARAVRSAPSELTPQALFAAERERRLPVKKLSELERRKLEMVRGTAPAPAVRPGARALPPRATPVRRPALDGSPRTAEAQTPPLVQPMVEPEPAPAPVPPQGRDEAVELAAAEEAPFADFAARSDGERARSGSPGRSTRHRGCCRRRSCPTTAPSRPTTGGS